MEQLLQADEKVIYRAEPAWRAILLMAGAGVASAFALSGATYLLDGNGHLALGAVVLAVVAFLVLVTSLVARRTAAIVTDRRLYCQDGGSGTVTIFTRADIVSADLVESDVPIAALRIRDRQSRDVTLKFLSAPRQLRHAVLHGEAGEAAPPRSLPGALLIILSFAAAALVAAGAFYLFGGYAIQPLGEIVPKAVEIALGTDSGLGHRLIIGSIFLILLVLTMGPIYGLVALALFLGYLPALAVSRALVPFDEAREMALIVRRRLTNSVTETPTSRWDWGHWFDPWLRLWIHPLGRPCAWLAEAVVSQLYQRPFDLPEQLPSQRA